MSLPQGQLTPICNAGAFLPPDDILRPDRTIDYELGGVGIQDVSQGLQVRTWVAELVHDDVIIYPEDNPLDVLNFYTESGITEISLAFDQNMNPAVGFIANGQAKLRWFNASAGSYQILDLPASSRSIMLCMDDKRSSATAGNYNDILVFYLRGNRLYYRQQRDLYGVEYELYEYTGTEDAYIRRVGFDKGFRVQVELYDLPALPGCANPTISGTEYPSGVTATIQQGSVGLLEHHVRLSGQQMTVGQGGTSIAGFKLPSGVNAEYSGQLNLVANTATTRLVYVRLYFYATGRVLFEVATDSGSGLASPTYPVHWFTWYTPIDSVPEGGSGLEIQYSILDDAGFSSFATEILPSTWVYSTERSLTPVFGRWFHKTYSLSAADTSKTETLKFRIQVRSHDPALHSNALFNRDYTLTLNATVTKPGVPAFPDLVPEVVFDEFIVFARKFLPDYGRIDVYAGKLSPLSVYPNEIRTIKEERSKSGSTIISTGYTLQTKSCLVSEIDATYGGDLFTFFRWEVVTVRSGFSTSVYKTIPKDQILISEFYKSYSYPNPFFRYLELIYPAPYTPYAVPPIGKYRFWIRLTPLPTNPRYGEVGYESWIEYRVDVR